MKLLKCIFIIVVAFAAAWNSSSPAPHVQSDESALIGKAAPAFNLNNYRGGTISADNLRGKVVLMVFWVPTVPESALLAESISAERVAGQTGLRQPRGAGKQLADAID